MINFKKRIIAVTPLLSLIIFLALGFYFDLWNPGWMIFLLIPTMPFLLGVKKIRITYSVICIITYLIIGFGFGGWHPAWIIFLTIPVFEILTRK